MTPAPDATPTPPGRRGLLLLLIALLTLAVHGRVLGAEFVNYDDPSYVSHNPVVQRGLTLDGVAYAFRGGHSTNWHPLTTLSHMLDVELFGDDAGGHHATSLVLHALNAVLALLLFEALTGSAVVAFLLAGLFAVHPLRVESVAWISERKDILSGTFFLLMLLGWLRYARSPTKSGYALVAGALAAGLMAKQMLITAPFVLVLLDVWPLERWRGARTEGGRALGSLVLEKLPLFLLALVAGVLTWHAQSAGGTLATALSPLDRTANAFGAILAYVRLTLLPIGLGPFYPHPALVHADAPLRLFAPALIGSLLVAGVTYVGLKRFREAPALLVGWSWFLGMLVPVLGLVQIGSQAYADRYSYLPSLGLLLAGWGVLAPFTAARPERARTAAALAALAVIAFSALTVRQAGFWTTSRDLHTHTLAVTERNYVAHNNLGLVRLEEDLDPVQAELEFARALELSPAFREARYNLAQAYLNQGRAQDAEAELSTLLEIDPGFARAKALRAQIASSRGDSEGAIALLQEVVSLDPANAQAWTELARQYALRKEGLLAQSAAENALELAPDNHHAHLLVAEAALLLGDLGAAIERLEAAAVAAPDEPSVHSKLGEALAMGGQTGRSRTQAERALALEPTHVPALVLLAKLDLLSRDVDSAGRRVEAALALDPDDVDALELHATLLWDPGGDIAGAERVFQQLLELDPENTSALYNLGALYVSQRREHDAVQRFLRIFEVDPDASHAGDAAGDLAWILATSPDPSLRDGAEARRYAEFMLGRSSELDIERPMTLIVIAAAMAAAGDFEKAVDAQERALERLVNPEQRRLHEQRLALYRSGQPFHRQR